MFYINKNNIEREDMTRGFIAHAFGEIKNLIEDAESYRRFVESGNAPDSTKEIHQRYVEERDINLPINLKRYSELISFAKREQILSREETKNIDNEIAQLTTKLGDSCPFYAYDVFRPMMN